jgi:hypothetical protein
MRTPNKGFWTRQPPENTRVLSTYQNPLAQALAIAVIPGEQEWFSKSYPVKSGTSSRGYGGWGRMVTTPSTQVAGSFAYTVNLPAAFDCTLLLLHRCITSNTPSVFAYEMNSVEPIQMGASGNLMRWHTASNSTSDIALTNGALNCIVGVKRVNSNELYLNGMLQTTAVTGNRTVDPITNVSFGRTGGLNNLENVEYSLCLYWQRALKVNEVKLISMNPWQLFAPSPSLDWSFLATAGAGNLFAQACL